MEYDAKACAAGVSSVCVCGKKSSGKRANCIEGEGKSRGSCVIRGASCTRKCRCRTCQNEETSKEDKEKQRSTGCPCGMNKKAFNRVEILNGKEKPSVPVFVTAQPVTQIFVFVDCEQSLFGQSRLSSAELERAN